MNAPLAITKPSLVHRFAEKYGVDESKFLDTLKATAFKQKEGVQISNEQMTMLLVVADQYGLNPFTKEIYAYPDKGAIVAVVSVDGWTRIINENAQMDGVEFVYSPETLTHKNKMVHEWIDCVITRKDRSKPIIVREYFDEVVRSASFPTPWDTHPKRMHRHKTLIQGSRIAFGFAGIYDQDEAERIVEGEVIESAAAKVIPVKPAMKELTMPELVKRFATDKIDDDGVVTKFSPKSQIMQGEETAQNLIDFLSAKYNLPSDVLEAINSWTPQGGSN